MTLEIHENIYEYTIYSAIYFSKNVVYLNSGTVYYAWHNDLNLSLISVEG